MNLIEKLGGYKKAKEIHDRNLVDFRGDATGVKVIMSNGLKFSHEELCAALADHNKCQHEWNETTSNGDKYRFFVCKHCDSTRNFIPLNEDITDYCSDIKNHLSPLTKVIDK